MPGAHAVREALRRCVRFLCLLLDAIEHPEELRRFDGDLVEQVLVQRVELAPCMRHAGALGHAVAEGRVVAWGSSQASEQRQYSLDCLLRFSMRKKNVHSVFRDLYPEDQAAEMGMRSLLLQGLSSWLAESGMTQTEAAKVLAVTQARVSDIKRGKISSFSLDLLVRLAARAGLNPKLKLVA